MLLQFWYRLQWWYHDGWDGWFRDLWNLFSADGNCTTRDDQSCYDYSVTATLATFIPRPSPWAHNSSHSYILSSLAIMLVGSKYQSESTSAMNSDYQIGKTISARPACKTFSVLSVQSYERCLIRLFDLIWLYFSRLSCQLRIYAWLLGSYPFLSNTISKSVERWRETRLLNTSRVIIILIFFVLDFFLSASFCISARPQVDEFCRLKFYELKLLLAPAQLRAVILSNDGVTALKWVGEFKSAHLLVTSMEHLLGDPKRQHGKRLEQGWRLQIWIDDEMTFHNIDMTKLLLCCQVM